MPDLETTRRLARVLDVSVREMLIRSGRLTAEELTEPLAHLAASPPTPTPMRRITVTEAAELLGVPTDRRERFARAVEPFLPTADTGTPLASH
jgi:hypothetical protein